MKAKLGFYYMIGSLWVMLSFYAPENVDFGRNVSHLFKANSLFVRRIKVAKSSFADF
jgi:hypothetical protein